MLVDLPAGWMSTPEDPITAIIARSMPGAMHGTRLQRVQRGVYLGHLNVRHDIEWCLADKYPRFSGEHAAGLHVYGVADDHQQILDRWGEVLESDARALAIFMTPIIRDEQPESGGWRWHKWGPYIGTQEPTREYLYDDTHIDRVYVFHIYELSDWE